MRLVWSSPAYRWLTKQPPSERAEIARRFDRAFAGPEGKTKRRLAPNIWELRQRFPSRRAYRALYRVQGEEAVIFFAELKKEEGERSPTALAVKRENRRQGRRRQ